MHIDIKRTGFGKVVCAGLLSLMIVTGAAAQESDPLSDLENRIEAGEFGQITSVVIEGPNLSYERHFDGAAADILRNTRSVTKTITGTLIGIAIDEGHITSANVSVLSFFPEIDASGFDRRKREMTLADLLTMTGPLECNDWNSFSRGNEERMYLVEDWVGFFFDLPIGAPPPWEPRAENRPFGKVYSYCTAGVFTLGRIVEIATGRELEDYAREKLFDPLGVGEVRWAFSPLNIAQGGGGLEMQSADLAKIAQLYVEGGRAAGTQLVSLDWVQRSVTPQAQIDDRTQYGYLWWLYGANGQGASEPMWMMSGSGGNKVVALPELNAVAVVTTTNFRRNDAHPLSERIISEFIVPAVKQASNSPD